MYIKLYLNVLTKCLIYSPVNFGLKFIGIASLWWGTACHQVITESVVSDERDVGLNCLQWDIT